MKVSELNGAHLGRVVTLQWAETTVTGRLFAVRHHGTLIREQTMRSPEPQYVIGQTWTDLQIGTWEQAEVWSDTACEVHDE